ncbi:MAG: membrane-bound lytic murein transglycosylase MltF [Betaproteobacteria bacterium]|nr:MAG: membrane-bound lytic murein transglycosylase MltF [Betaproteobacteria bacterium]
MHIFLSFFSFVICSFLIAACDSFEKSVPLLDKTDELIVITVSSRDTYYKNPEGRYVGLEFDLTSEFARVLGKKVRFIVVSNKDEALSTLEKHQGHLAVGISVTIENQLRIRFGPIYQRAQPQVAYNTNYPKPRNIQDLVGKDIEIVRGTVHVERLNEARLRAPDLRWTETDLSTDDLLTRLAEGKIDHVVADSIHISLAKNFHTNLDVAINLGKENGKAWAFSSYGEPGLQKKVQKFFKRIEGDGTLNRLLDRYYGHIHRLGQEDVSEFLEKIRTLLPALRKYFYQAEEITKIDWRLIAALAYQESHWDRMATSPTNVRGIMMLTEDTADRMEVTDRLDARQSILAGARYLLILKDMLPARIDEPDRTWIALAAYNQGYGHIEDARILAQRMKLSPDLWVDLKRSLPLLSNSEYFEKLKHGYARGGEAVLLTEFVRTYYNILLQQEPLALGILHPPVVLSQVRLIDKQSY